MTDAPILAPRPTAGLQSYRDVLLQLSQPIVDQVRAEVPAYRGPDGGRRHQLISRAADAALDAFVEIAARRAPVPRKLDELFHRMGWGEAQDGNDTENLELAMQVAMRVIWRHLTDFAVDRNQTVEGLRDLIDALLEYRDHLHAQLMSGHSMWGRDPYYDENRARVRLWDLLWGGTVGRISPLRPLGLDTEVMNEAALQAGWPVPDQVVAIAVSYHGKPPPLPETAEVLAKLQADRLHLLCPADLVGTIVSDLTRSATDRRVVVSWPVTPEESGSALLWSLRALDLVQLGVIPPTQVVRCVDHTIQLWLHAEPLMRRRLCQELLEPLLAESPNSREILSETLLTWLETRDSAPAIAARLDVHPQTVRYRWRRINELFGEALHDPEFVIQITLVLKSSLLLWKGGDQRDFDLFRDMKEAGQ
ncbi:helix-turn-helix domain-containing protein [Nocardioides marmoriginsengisoli]|nr:helix-turn-helix domain-containing protein [Nocardioides marmoriginsengisoli]